jgi:dUTP pyrophosphatase
VKPATLRPAPTSVAVRVRRLPHAEGIELPAYMTAGAAAADIRAAVETPVTIAPGSIMTIPTGLAFEIPPGWEVQIRPRSGLAARHGITVVNAPATIDADYRGEVMVALVHLGAEPFVIERGMRIAQILLGRVTRIEWEEAAELTETGRGTGGFGHSGTR